MAASKSRQSFWTSKAVSSLIGGALKQKNPCWQPTPGVSAWMDLREEIVKANSKGVCLVPPPLVPPYGYCIDQLPFERDNGAASYLRLRYLLGVFADLLSLARQKIDKVHGRDAWQRASSIITVDAESRTLFRFLREVSAAPRPQAVHCLESVSKRGLVIVWPGRVRSGFSARDCGLEALVHVSQMIFDALGDALVSQPAEEENHRKHVTVKSAGPNLVELRYQGQLVQLRGNLRMLVLHLFWNKERAIPFKELWTILYLKKTRQEYKPDKRGGPPPCLRRTKADLEKKLHEVFGPPKGRRYWVESHQGCGYRLNVASVDWQVAVGSMDYPLFTRDQSDLADARDQ
jgi:hypothetical protein